MKSVSRLILYLLPTVLAIAVSMEVFTFIGHAYVVLFLALVVSAAITIAIFTFGVRERGEDERRPYVPGYLWRMLVSVSISVALVTISQKYAIRKEQESEDRKPPKQVTTSLPETVPPTRNPNIKGYREVFLLPTGRLSETNITAGKLTNLVTFSSGRSL